MDNYSLNRDQELPSSKYKNESNSDNRTESWVLDYTAEELTAADMTCENENVYVIPILIMKAIMPLIY